MAAAALPFIPSLLAGGAAGIAAYSSYKAGKDAKEAAARNAAMEAERTKKETRTLKLSNERTEALARARAAASGVGGTTTNAYMQALIKSGQEEVDWLKEVGASNYQKAIAEGASAASQAQYSMFGSLVGVAGAATDAYSLWKK